MSHSQTTPSLFDAPDPAGNQLSLCALLARVSRTLSGISDVAVSLQNTLSDSLPVGALDRRTIMDLQGLDRLAQIAADLGVLLENASALIIRDEMLEADLILRRVKLMEVAQQVSNCHSEPAVVPVGSLGEILFF